MSQHNKKKPTPKDTKNVTTSSGSYDTQNPAHNIKKVSLGPNTDR